MRPSRRATLAALALSVCFGATGAAPADLNLPPVAFTERHLPNGLQVIAVPNPASPGVSVQVWYHVGAKDDPPGRSGFAHLFEHLMFKGTRYLRAEQFDRLTEDIGGANNAFTSDDVTAYQSVVPANHLETLLWAEAERMGNLDVQQAGFESERAVVTQEYRERVLTPPYGRFALAIASLPYRVHPYRRPLIGSIADLEAARLDDVVAFHAAHYRPDNATLVVAGNFDPQQLDAWVDQYFAPVPRPPALLRHVDASEPAWPRDRRIALTGPQVALPAVALAWLAPPLTSPDAPALRVAAALLGGGESARLNQALVYRRQLAAQASFDADLRAGPGLLIASATAAGSQSLAGVEAGLLAELLRLTRQPVGAAELAKVKRQLLTGALLTRQTPEGLASAVAEAAVLAGDAAHVNLDLAALQRVSAADVRRVLRRYFAGTHKVTIRYTQAAAEPTPPLPPPSIPPIPPPLPAARVDAAPARVGDATAGFPTPPPPGAARPLVIATPTEQRLPNGLRVVLAARPGVRLVSAQLVVLTGAEVDPPQRAGLASLSAALLTKGSLHHSGPALARAAEALGGTLDSAASWNQSQVSMTVMTAQIDAALALLADAALHPAFAGTELERLRAQTLDALKVTARQPATLALHASDRMLFADHPYGHALDGTPASLQRIQRADVLALHRAHYRPDNAVLVLAGDLDAATALRLAARHFGAWQVKRSTGPSPLPPPPPPPPQLPLPLQPSALVPPAWIGIDVPTADQASVVVAARLPVLSSAERATAAVLNTVLGSDFSSRLNQEIRIQRGLSYGVDSQLDARPWGGALRVSVQTRHASAAEVVQRVQTALRRLADESVPDAELAARKAALIGNFGRSIETTAGLAQALRGLVVAGTPVRELAQRIPAVAAVSPADIQDFAARHLTRTRQRIVVAGTLREFGAPLQAQASDAGTAFTTLNAVDMDRDD